MANEEHLAILRRGVDAWNRWRQEHPATKPDLSGALLNGADLRGAKLFVANLSGACLDAADLRAADLSGARLCRASLYEADISEAFLNGASLREAKLRAADLSATVLSRADVHNADLHGANLNVADLTAADLSGANLAGADLSYANLSASNLSDANLDRSIIGYARFCDVDLSRTKNLDRAWYTAPSTVGIDTIYRSQGKVPLIFLRGCGVPENFITYMPSLVAAGPIQFYSCFISYSTEDQEFADRLYADLQNKGVRCWFAPHDVQGGKKLHEQIDEAIRMHERLLLILSPNSMSSKWVKTEIRNARKREVAEKKRVLFPVRLASYEALRDWKLFDADEGEDLATEIREYYIPDFSEWKTHELYVREFEKLLRDLRTEGAA